MLRPTQITDNLVAIQPEKALWRQRSLTDSSALDIESFRGLLVVLAAVRTVQIVRAVQAVQKDRKLSAAVERSEAIEQLERLELTGEEIRRKSKWTTK
jgi:hypothetical protein